MKRKLFLSKKVLIFGFSLFLLLGGYALLRFDWPLLSTSPTPKANWQNVVLPPIIVRQPISINRSGWRKFNDRGFQYSYPQNWFVTGSPGQIQNWNPKTSRYSGPLRSGDAKWDFDLTELGLFTDIEQVIKETIKEYDLIRIDGIEKVTKDDGITIYFVTYKEVLFGGVPHDPFVIATIVTKDGKYLTWLSLSPDGSNFEVLKTIVETIRKI